MISALHLLIYACCGGLISAHCSPPHCANLVDLDRPGMQEPEHPTPARDAVSVHPGGTSGLHARYSFALPVCVSSGTATEVHSLEQALPAVVALASCLLIVFAPQQYREQQLSCCSECQHHIGLIRYSSSVYVKKPLCKDNAWGCLLLKLTRLCAYFVVCSEVDTSFKLQANTWEETDQRVLNFTSSAIVSAVHQHPTPAAATS